MQTFLPYPDFARSASVLDNKRLGKQRVEAKQILCTLLDLNLTDAWKNHPAVRMWRGAEGSLAFYTQLVCVEWVRRGFKDSCHRQIIAIENRWLKQINYVSPWWLGDEKFHLSHQSNLIRKDPEFYGPKFPGVPPDLPYVWPK